MISTCTTGIGIFRSVRAVRKVADLPYPESAQINGGARPQERSTPITSSAFSHLGRWRAVSGSAPSLGGRRPSWRARWCLSRCRASRNSPWISNKRLSPSTAESGGDRPPSEPSSPAGFFGSTHLRGVKAGRLLMLSHLSPFSGALWRRDAARRLACARRVSFWVPRVNECCVP